MIRFKISILTLVFFSLFFETRGHNAETNFDELDRCILNRSVYEKAKIQKINFLHRLLKQPKSIFQSFEIYSRMYQEYKAFKYDSAYVYGNIMLKLAEQMNDSNLIGKSKIALSFSCRSAGLYKEAYDLLYSIAPNSLSEETKADLYAYRSSFNIELAQFFGNEPYYSKYFQESLACSKITSQIAKHEDIFINSAKIRVFELQKDYHSAIKLAKFYMSKKKSDEHDYAMLAADIGGYLMLLGDTTQAIHYYTLAAIADIKSATKETTAITILAEILYRKKDFKRAHTYIVQALEDADYYNARQRKVQVSSIFPIIEAERFQMMQQQKNNLLVYSLALSVLLILLLVAVFVILKQTSRLNKAKELIQHQNEELLVSNEELTHVQEKIKRQNAELIQINEKLKETHRIKDEYIGFFFSVNSSYLEKMEEYRKLVTRKIRNKQASELLEINASSSFQQERESMFDLFDQIFLKLFPDFVYQYNQLFDQQDRVVLKNERVLCAELRIFALIRLGISESERIAKFLDYSVHTVNNYKTKVKNRSIVPNEQFEQKIMQIESIETNLEH